MQNNLIFQVCPLTVISLWGCSHTAAKFHFTSLHDADVIQLFFALRTDQSQSQGLTHKIKFTATIKMQQIVKNLNHHCGCFLSQYFLLGVVYQAVSWSGLNYVRQTHTYCTAISVMLRENSLFLSSQLCLICFSFIITKTYVRTFLLFSLVGR